MIRYAYVNAHIDVSNKSYLTQQVGKEKKARTLKGFRFQQVLFNPTGRE